MFSPRLMKAKVWGTGLTPGRPGRRRAPFLALGFVLAWLVFVPAGSAGFGAFFYLNGIPGDSTDSRHRDWMDVLVVSNRVEGPTNLTRPVFHEFCLQKWLDKASPSLDLACARGQVFPNARLEFVQTNGTRLKFYQIDLTNVVVTRMETSGQGRSSDGKPQEAVQLSYEVIAWTYTQFDLAGQPKADFSAYWDIIRNVGGRSTSLPFRLSCVRYDKDNVLLTWPGKAGKVYTIWSSPQVAGPYSVLTQVPVQNDGPATQLVPSRNGAQFFTAEEGT